MPVLYYVFSYLEIDTAVRMHLAGGGTLSVPAMTLLSASLGARLAHSLSRHTLRPGVCRLSWNNSGTHGLGRLRRRMTTRLTQAHAPLFAMNTSSPSRSSVTSI